MAGAGC